jgi:hypothetical protein
VTGASIDDGLVTIARIVATVDLERALVELGRNALEAGAGVEDPLLGARVVLIDGEPAGSAGLALAEPTTEGRLAATLARHGEGDAGRYAALAAHDDLAAFRRRAATAGVALSRVASGPYGRAVLVLGGSIAGPHLIVTDPRPLPSEP